MSPSFLPGRIAGIRISGLGAEWPAGRGLVLAGDRLVGVVTLSDLAPVLDPSPARVRVQQA